MVIKLSPKEEQDVKYLIKNVQDGKIALFIGAGTSIGSKAPSNVDLITSIKNEFQFIDFEDVGNNLLDICQEIAEEGRKPQLKEFIEKIFYGLGPSNAHKDLPLYPWPVIFTTNYDELLENAFEEYYAKNKEKARRCMAVFRGDIQQHTSRKDVIFLYKLMGGINRESEDEKPVLTRSDFNSRANFRQKMLEMLTSFVHNGEVLFIGYSFKDRLIFEIIDELIKFSGMENIGKSFALDPNIETGSKEYNTLIKRKIQPLRISFEDFMEKLKEGYIPIALPKKPTGIPLRLKLRNVEIPYRDYKEFQEHFNILCDFEIEKKKFDQTLSEKERISLFLKGYTESWEPFEKDWDFKRDTYSKIKETLLTEMENKKPEYNKSFLILGGGGLGKSVLMKRVAYDFYRLGYPVIILHSRKGYFDKKLIEKFYDEVNKGIIDLESISKLLVILDNADINIEDVAGLVSYLGNRSKSAILLGAARPNEWEIAKRAWGYGGVVPEDRIFRIEQKMGNKEIIKLVKHIERILEREFFISDETIIDFVDEQYKKDFFATIYGLMDPARRRLEEIIIDEYEKLPSIPTKLAYEYVSLFYQYEIPLKLEMLMRPLNSKFGFSYTDFEREILNTEAKTLILPIEGPFDDIFYIAKNRIISEKLVEELFNPHVQARKDMMIDKFISILSRTRVLDKAEMDIVRSILVRYLGPNGRDKDKFTDDEKITIYNSLIENGIEDSAILHHYGLIEIERDNFEKSESLLKKAISLSEKYRGGGLGTEPLKNLFNSLGKLYSYWGYDLAKKGAIDESYKKYDLSERAYNRGKIKEPSSPYPYCGMAYSYYHRAKRAEEQGKMEEAYEYLAISLETIEQSKESVPEGNMEMLLELESRIYSEKFWDYGKAKSKLLEFLKERREVVFVYLLLGELSFREAKEKKDNLDVYNKLLQEANEYVVKGLKLNSSDSNLLRLKYLITRSLEPENFEVLYDLLVKRYKSFEGECMEFQLLFELGAIAFELEKYNDSKQYFRELERRSYEHPKRGGIIKVAKDLEKFRDKIFKGQVTLWISEREAYITSKEFGKIPFIPIVQKRKINLYDEMEFKVGFNYRGWLAVDLRPI